MEDVLSLGESSSFFILPMLRVVVVLRWAVGSMFATVDAIKLRTIPRLPVRSELSGPVNGVTSPKCDAVIHPMPARPALEKTKIRDDERNAIWKWR